jgi:transcriptional regulator GlxA family with amidase domain
MAPIQFGVLLVPCQLSDISGPLDVLFSCTKPYIEELSGTGAPNPLADNAIDIEIHYIGETLEPVKHSAGFRSVPTTTTTTCPPLDYLLVGGTDLEYIKNLPEAMKAFIHSRLDQVKSIFATCTGGMILAQTGVLDGKNATTNHVAVPFAIQIFPDVKWSKEKQWVKDGKFITAGGAYAGVDMMVDWVIENYSRELVAFGLEALDYQPRDVNRNIIPGF